MQSFFISSFLSAIFLYLYFCIYKNKYNDDKKKLSWVLTQISAKVLAPIGFYYMLMSIYVYQLNMNLFFIENDNLNSVYKEIPAGFFFSYLLLDIALGLKHYKSEMTFMGSTIHHTAFIFATIYLLQIDQITLINFAFFLEIPTLFLSEVIFSEKQKERFKIVRFKIYFYCLFFLLRVFMVAVYTIAFISTKVPLSNTIMIIGVFILNFLWFIQLKPVFKKNIDV